MFPKYIYLQPKQELLISKISPNVHQEPLSVSYSKWDKYNPDVEIMKLDNQEKIEKLLPVKKSLSRHDKLKVESINSLSFQDRYNSMKNHVNSNNGQYK